MAEDVPFDLEAIRTRCSQNITEIVANPREYFRVQQILRDRLALLAEVDRLRALQRSEVLSGDSQSSSETGKKLAYFETHEPPHCPTCACHVCICTAARGIEPGCPIHSPVKAEPKP